MSVKISSTKKYAINYSKRESSIPIINEYICELQACLAQYLTVSLDKHMKLKDTHSNNEKRGAIETLFNDLNDFLNESIDNAFEITHQHIDKYFSGRSKFHPRITIKAPFEEQLIVDLYRKDRSPFNQFGVTENTAFKYIKDTGKYFICNDIPKAVKEEKYENKRINGKMVRSNYELPGIFKRIHQSLLEQPEVDSAWESCWDTGSTERPHTDSCYKSTIVVPMTLINAKLCRDFKQYMLVDSESLESDDKYRKLMFGFLCFDHRHTEYFNYESDIRIGYIVADILSLFLIIRMMCTSKSRTYRQVSELIG